MHIPMTDLTTQYTSIKEEIDEAIRRVIESGRFILGPEVEAFEKEIAAYCGAKYAIGVASGTDALIISLKACGVKTSDEVITTPFTFFATAEAITHCGGALTLIAGPLTLTQTKLNPELQPRLVPSFPFIYSDNLLKWMLF